MLEYIFMNKSVWRTGVYNQFNATIIPKNKKKIYKKKKNESDSA
jgi:hypothetical protein